MINHGRTLLMNIEGPVDPKPGNLLDAYIPKYKPVTFSAAVEALRSLIFGSAPDYEGRLQRVAQCMVVLHSTEFASHLLALDPRVTYPVKSADSLAVSSRAAVDYAPVDYPAQLVQGIGVDGTNFIGRARYAWEVTTLTEDTVRVTRTHDQYSVEQPVAFANRLSNPIPLPGGSHVLYIKSDSNSVETSKRWRVSAYYRVAPDLAQVLAALPGPGLSEIFAEKQQEPVASYWNLFTEGREFHLRFSGVLLALIHLTERLRVDGH